MDTEKDIRAAIVAHAIRLGKTLTPGTRVACSAILRTVDGEAFRQGDLSDAKDETGKVPVEFTVTEEDIGNAKRMINEQRISYREPKTSILALKSGKPSA